MTHADDGVHTTELDPGLIDSAVETRPLVPLPGIVWRSCRFRHLPVTALCHPTADQTLRIDLPDDLSGAVAKRRSEFLAGRLCAALALKDIGMPTFVGRRGRAPVWPPGICGSISHTNGRALAVVSDRYRALGVDCETVLSEELARELEGVVLAPGDAKMRPDAMAPQLFLTLCFAAKEAVYKALSADLPSAPDFTDACVEDVRADSLAVFLGNRRTTVAYRFDGDDCVALAWIV